MTKDKSKLILIHSLRTRLPVPAMFAPRNFLFTLGETKGKSRPYCDNTGVGQSDDGWDCLSKASSHPWTAPALKQYGVTNISSQHKSQCNAMQTTHDKSILRAGTGSSSFEVRLQTKNYNQQVLLCPVSSLNLGYLAYLLLDWIVWFLICRVPRWFVLIRILLDHHWLISKQWPCLLHVYYKTIDIIYIILTYTIESRGNWTARLASL